MSTISLVCQNIVENGEGWTQVNGLILIEGFYYVLIGLNLSPFFMGFTISFDFFLFLLGNCFNVHT